GEAECSPARAPGGLRRAVGPAGGRPGQGGAESVQMAAPRALARELMDGHGLQDWTLRVDTAKRRAGLCRYDRRLISVAKPLTALYTPEQVRETVLHESAHARAGDAAGHGASRQSSAPRIRRS